MLLILHLVEISLPQVDVDEAISFFMYNNIMLNCCFTVGTMLFYGGTLTGKADFNIMTELLLDGSTKYIQSLAKLVNKGHCEWGAGDLIASNNGDFQNFGTVQMRYGSADFSSNAYYIGSAVPIENGGDVFAKDFHSWDTDLGALSTSEYTRLTSELVSRVPNGWTAADQGDDDS